MSIRVLPPEVIDQIAAGEVVERPAHLVKELLENSLDAGATEIELDFDQGGRWVRVRDNGAGIAAEDLPRAVARHATSKIALTSDIWNLSSYGFRGEALAAIAAVSRFTLTARTPETATASQLAVEFGRMGEVVAVGGELGTSVLIEDLFANLPTRLKFLKSEAAEAGQIKNVVKALAMANYRVGFRLRQGNKLIYYWPACESRKQRVEQVLEHEPLYAGDYAEPGLKVEAYCAAPHQTERSSRQMWIFAQNRWVQDRGIQAAIMDSYRNLLMHGEYPIAAVWVHCDPSQIDVNIHPAKSAVKFQNSSQVFRAVVRAVRGLLEKAPWVEGVVAAQAPARPAPSAASETLAFADDSFLRTQFAKREASLNLETLRTYSQEPTRAFVQAPAETYSPEQRSSGPVTSGQSSSVSPSVSSQWRSLQILGQANLTYIVCQSSKGLVLIDQHAAHERVGFERLMNAWRGGWIDIQQYLLPLQIDLDAALAEGVISQRHELEKLGLHVEQAGPGTVAVTAAPSLLNEEAVVCAIQRIGEDVVERGGSFALEKIVADICATMACHSVVRAGQPLSPEQMRAVLEQMDEFPLSSFCPHGRPVSVEYPFDKLERDFGRTL